MMKTCFVLIAPAIAMSTGIRKRMGLVGSPNGVADAKESKRTKGGIAQRMVENSKPLDANLSRRQSLNKRGSKIHRELREWPN